MMMMMKSALSKSKNVFPMRQSVRLMSGLHSNILETIGRTPVVKINKISPRDDVEIYAKVGSYCFFFFSKKNKIDKKSQSTV